jgi:hypothetical protein
LFYQDSFMTRPSISDIQLLRLKNSVCGINAEKSLLVVSERLRKYRPDQPRNPSGRSDGGRWTSTDGSSGDRVQTAQDDAGTAIIAA